MVNLIDYTTLVSEFFFLLLYIYDLPLLDQILNTDQAIIFAIYLVKQCYD